MKKIYSLLLIVFVAFSYAQKKGVGINTDTPTATLHVKSNRKYIMRVRKIALPADKKYNGFLVENKNGKGDFGVKGTDFFRTTVTTELPENGVKIINNEDWQPTKIKITLPPGFWYVCSNFLLKMEKSLEKYPNNSYVVTATLADDGSTKPSEDIVSINKGGGSIPAEASWEITKNARTIYLGALKGPINNGILVGNLVIYNSGDTEKTYEVVAKLKNYEGTGEAQLNNSVINFGDKNILENQLYAIPLFKSNKQNLN